MSEPIKVGDLVMFVRSCCDTFRDGVSIFVVASAVVALFTGPETYILPSTKGGVIKSYGELDGSYRGDMDHAEALKGAGYSLTA